MATIRQRTNVYKYPGRKAQNYTPGNLTQTTYFRRNTISSQEKFRAAISNIITVTYDLDTDANLISTANPCSADRTFILNFDEKVFTSNNGTGDVSAATSDLPQFGDGSAQQYKPIGISTEQQTMDIAFVLKPIKAMLHVTRF